MTYTEEQVQEALEWADGPRVPPVQILAAALRDARAERARLLDEAAERMCHKADTMGIEEGDIIGLLAAAVRGEV